MKEIEEFINRVCRSLRVEPALRDHIREELREHLSEAVECHVKEGLPEEQAVKRAIEEFGSAEAIGHELSSIHSGNLLSFLMKKAMSWRERTMKTEWKWNFVALAALVFTIGLNVILSMACITFIFPRIRYTYDYMDWPMPRMFNFAVAGAEMFTKYSYALPLLLLAGWILFEVFYKKEAKTHIRLATFAVVSLAAALFFAVASLSALIPAAQAMAPWSTLASSSALGMRSAGMVQRKMLEADALVSELSDACNKGDWVVIRDDAHDLHVICQSFMFTRADNLAKVMGKTAPSKNSKLTRLLQEMEEQGEALVWKARARDLPAVQDHLAILKKSLQELREALGLEEPGAKAPQGPETP